MEIQLTGQRSVYVDIVEQYKRFIKLGAIKEGEKLPSCRQLATALGINPNTVERAFSILEHDGFVRTIEKKGVYVCFQAKQAEGTDEYQYKEIIKEIKVFRNSDIPKALVLKAIEEVYNF